ncbi:uncharacterized protein [Eurosta solidaginis]|uniref:uncharacterized protein isoform X2 n=1 Tax=Eurosta solidaginis TaxID=178769 RepID=UPI00353110EC
MPFAYILTYLLITYIIKMPKSSPLLLKLTTTQKLLYLLKSSTPLNRLLATAFLIYCLQSSLHINCHAILLKCPLYQMHLQKIVGFRPPLEYLTAQNLIYSPAYNFKDRNRHKRQSNNIAAGVTDVYNPAQKVASATASSICWRICNDDNDCIAYVHLLDTNECYGYSYFERTPHYLAIASELPLVADAEAVFYEKTCLKVPAACKQRKWTLTKIPGTSLVLQGKKTIATLVTRRECAERCLFEDEFKCLSASFAPSYRNNRERLSQHMPPEDHNINPQQQQHQQSQHNTIGRCILSDKDKMIQPDAFRAAPYDEEYMENQCYERPIENDNCSYELYANSSFIYAEARYLGLTQKECQQYCSHEAKFYCQGVSFHLEGDLANSECLLHSEDIISMGPRSLKQREKSIYMRRVKCLDVQVLCTQNEMTIKYSPKDWFNGKMYANMHSKQCVVQGNGTKSTVLRLPIGTEVTENRCGILRAYEVTKAYQRIFISALIVIQNNANVQTQGDRLIKVGCIMSNSTLRKDEHKDGRSDDVDDVTEGEDIPNAIALESSLEFAQRMLPNEGSIFFNSSDVPLLPKVYLQILDISHQHETNDVLIGQNLELQIIAEYSPHQQQLINYALPPLPDFRATSLIAKTQDNQNFVQLIDERGCPIDATVFPALERFRSSSKNMLRARFHAFKFAGSSLVNFDVKIRFCMQRCPDDNCYPYGSGNNGSSGGFSNDADSVNPANNVNKTNTARQRRQIQTRPVSNSDSVVPLSNRFKVQNPVYISTVMDVAKEEPLEQMNLTHDSKTEENMTKQDFGLLPLNYNLHVRGPDQMSSNNFIYGERGVLLIAGIDHMQLDNFCLNQSLLIALLIFWLIFQVALMFGCCYAVQKYKRVALIDEERRKIQESLDYLESRRVHWADQGGYTL